MIISELYKAGIQTRPNKLKVLWSKREHELAHYLTLFSCTLSLKAAATFKAKAMDETSQLCILYLL